MRNGWTSIKARSGARPVAGALLVLAPFSDMVEVGSLEYGIWMRMVFGCLKGIWMKG